MTGAGSGIGAAVARALGQEGAHLALCGRRVATLEQVRTSLDAPPNTHLSFPLDVRDSRAVEETFDRVSEVLGPVDALALCHGVNTIRPLEQLEDGVWDEIVDTNLTGAFHCLRAAVRRMRPRGKGRIVLISSVSGRPGFEKFTGFAAYCASKYALTGLVEVAAAELEGTGIGLAMLCPTGVDTQMFRETFPDARASLTAEDVARSVLALLDPAAPQPQGAIIDLI